MNHDFPGFSEPVLPQPGPGEHLFAWDGVAFVIPSSWELAQWDLQRGVTSVVLEDDCERRLDAQWLLPDSVPAAEKVQQRFQQQARAIAAKAAAVVEVLGLDDAWTAHEYRMDQGATLAIAYRVPTCAGEPMALFQLHFAVGCREVPAVVMRSLARSFCWYTSGMAPWQFYDVAFALPRDFRLAATALQAGRKMLQFEWRLRRLFIWHFSLADIVIAKQSPAAFCADFIQGSKLLPVPRWTATPDGQLTYHRRRLHFFGQFEEIGRCCFKYYAWCHHDPTHNQIALWVYQYRREADLRLLPAAVRLGYAAP